MWVTNESKVRSLIACALKEYENLPRREQDQCFGKLFDNALNDGLLSEPAELIGGQWRLTVAPDAHTVTIDMKFADAESEAAMLKYINGSKSHE